MSSPDPPAQPSETTPLLRDIEAEDPALTKPKPITPLPRLQLFIICCLRVTEPMCFLVIFPFINQMLLAVGAAKDEQSVGYSAGIIEGIFSITQLLTVFHWGSLSDRIGRKPVLIMGAVGSAVSAVFFGLSRSFTTMIISRCINGMMNGNVGVLKAIMSEIADETNEAKAFSFFPLCLNIGVLIASYLGGTFADTPKRFPKLAQLFPIFSTFPYLLPNLFAALFPCIAAILAAMYLVETLPSKLPNNSQSVNASARASLKSGSQTPVGRTGPTALPTSTATAGDDSDSASDTVTSSQNGEDTDHTAGADEEDREGEEEEPTPQLKDLFSPHINALMISFGILSLMGGAHGALIPLFTFTPVRDGGLGFSEEAIGNAMSVRAVATIVVQMGAFPYLQRRFGTTKLYRWTIALWLPAFLGLPVCNLMARAGSPTWLIWVVLSTALGLSAVANMSFVCNLLMTNAAAPSRRALGAINGYAQVVSSLVRIVGPGGASILYAISISTSFLGGNLIWAAAGAVAVMGIVSGLFV